MNTQTTLERVLYKLVGARYITTLLMTGTFCLITYKTLMLFFANLANKETIDVIEKVAMFILGAFCTQMANVLASYFGRNDRAAQREKEDNENGNETA